jgi:hypothetical protein
MRQFNPILHKGSQEVADHASRRCNTASGLAVDASRDRAYFGTSAGSDFTV